MSDSQPKKDRPDLFKFLAKQRGLYQRCMEQGLRIEELERVELSDEEEFIRGEFKKAWSLQFQLRLSRFFGTEQFVTAILGGIDPLSDGEEDTE